MGGVSTEQGVHLQFKVHFNLYPCDAHLIGLRIVMLAQATFHAPHRKADLECINSLQIYVHHLAVVNGKPVPC